VESIFREWGFRFVKIKGLPLGGHLRGHKGGNFDQYIKMFFS